MESNNQLPEDLLKAAENLEERFRMLRVPARKATRAEWDAVFPEICRHVPEWIQLLLAQFSLLGGVLEYRDQKESYVRQFRLCKPVEYAHELEAGKERWEVLPKFGFVPIAYESNGSMWVTKITSGPSGEIYLLEHSGWDGGEPTKQNGLVFASSRLSLLLASMGVSEVSYYETPGGITSLIWHKEKFAP